MAPVTPKIVLKHMCFLQIRHKQVPPKIALKSNQLGSVLEGPGSVKLLDNVVKPLRNTIKCQAIDVFKALQKCENVNNALCFKAIVGDVDQFL